MFGCREDPAIWTEEKKDKLHSKNGVYSLAAESLIQSPSVEKEQDQLSMIFCWVFSHQQNLWNWNSLKRFSALYGSS